MTSNGHVDFIPGENSKSGTRSKILYVGLATIVVILVVVIGLAAAIYVKLNNQSTSSIPAKGGTTSHRAASTTPSPAAGTTTTQTTSKTYAGSLEDKGLAWDQSLSDSTSPYFKTTKNKEEQDLELATKETDLTPSATVISFEKTGASLLQDGPTPTTTVHFTLTLTGSANAIPTPEKLEDQLAKNSNWTAPKIYTYTTTSQVPSTKTTATTATTPQTPGTTTMTSKKSSTTSSVTTTPNPISGWQEAANFFKMAMNQTADPCNDFYEFACGGWINSHPLPQGSSHIYTYTLLQDEVINDTIDAIEALDSKNLQASQTQTMTRTIFESCAQSTHSQISHNTAILGLLAQYGGGFMFNASDVVHMGNLTVHVYEVGAWMGLLQGHHGVASLLNAYVDTDWRNASNYALVIDQGTVDLGAADLYLNATYANVTAQYKQTMLTVLTQLATDEFGDTNAVKNLDLPTRVQEIFDFETKVAALLIPDADRRNYSEMYNPIVLQDAQRMWPHINWTLYIMHVLPFNHIANLNLVDQHMKLIIQAPSYLDGLNQLVGNTSPHIVSNYLLWRLIDSLNDFYDAPSREEYRKLLMLRDQKSDLPPAKQDCVNTIITYLPYAAGRFYVDAKFTEDARTEVGNMISNIHSAFGEMLLELYWLDITSTRHAFTKLENIIRNPGYPTWITNNTLLDAYHSGLVINATGAWFDNYNAIVQWSMEKQYSELLMKSVDRHDFLGSPATVNAWYQPELNSITFPAGILQPPFFKVNYPKAINYGCIGTVMGHETTHGFDDEGVQFYDNGTLYTWMNERSQRGFKTMTECVVDEYSQFCYNNPHLCLNGPTNQGENVADNGGIREAFRAYRNYIRMIGKEEEPLPGLEKYSMDQMFFVGFASFWCGSQTPDYLQNLILTNPHSPARNRVMGTLRNFPTFGETFQCKKGVDVMYPADDDKCYVWANPPNISSNASGFVDAAQFFKTSMNITVDPCDNFYEFACGNWIATYTNKTDGNPTGTFDVLNDDVNAKLIYETKTISPTESSTALLKTKWAFTACVNGTNGQNASDYDHYNATIAYKSLLDEFQHFGGWPLLNASWREGDSTFGEIIGGLYLRDGISVVVDVNVDVDYRNVSRYALFLDVGDFALNPYAYNDTSALDEYTNLAMNISMILYQHIGQSYDKTQLKTDIDALVEFERQLVMAVLSVPPPNQPNISSQINEISLYDLSLQLPHFSWSDYFDNMLPGDYAQKITSNYTVIISQPKPVIFQKFDAILKATPMRTKVNYALWRLVFTYANVLGFELGDAFENFKRAVNKVAYVPTDLETQCNNMLGNLGLSYAQSYLFVKEYFPATARSDVDDMLKGILGALRNTLSSLYWLDIQSTPSALFKVDNVVRNAGYPDWIMDKTTLDQYYAELNIQSGDFFYLTMVMNLQDFSVRKQLEMLFSPVDRHNFNGPPSAVNAWYQPQLNSITFPAAILQPPFYRHDYPRYINYGGIGVVMGHELTHGFDNSGVQFDWNGTLHTWMDQRSLDGFNHMAECVVDQYSTFCFNFPGQKPLCIIGQQTEGENIADNGGIREAYAAYMAWVANNSVEPRMPGLEKITPEQAFFLSFAGPWCEVVTNVSIAAQLEYDVHSPGRFRVMGTTRNFEKFGEAYGCTRGDVMYPMPTDTNPATEQCYVWANPEDMVSHEPGYSDAAEMLTGNMQPTADPCDDFYEFACGNFATNYKLPPSTDSYSTFDVVADRVTNILTQSLDNLTEPLASAAIRKTKLVYDLCVNSQISDVAMNAPLLAKINKLGGWPIVNASINATDIDLPRLIATLDGHNGVPTLMSIITDVDYHNTNEYALFIDQGTVGLDSRTYFLNKTTIDGEQLTQYLDLIINVTTTLAMDVGADTANIAADAKNILDFEINLAKSLVPDDDRRNYSLMDNHLRLGNLLSYWNIDWQDYVKSALPTSLADKVSLGMTIYLMEPQYVRELSSLIARTPRSTVVNYLMWRYTQSQLMFLDQRIKAAYHQFLKVHKHINDNQLLDKATCVNNVLVTYMPYSTGRLFVDAAFPPTAKDQVEMLIGNIVNAFADDVKNLTWMDVMSKTAAQFKAHNVVQNPAYPPWILNDMLLDGAYENLTIFSGAKFFDVYQQLIEFTSQSQLALLSAVPNRSDFHGSPATVNAWYYPEFNSITFPAGILQPPFFRQDFPKAVNYGAIGAVMGHELTHGFDDEGVQFDYQGALNTWMSQSSIQGFTNMAQCVVEEYGRYCYNDTMYNDINLCVDGVQTQGEDIADNGGIKEAFNAYMNYSMSYGAERRLPGMEKFSPQQVFFLSFANFWCGKISDKALRTQLLRDPHSPWRVRVYEAVRNFDEFGKAFQCSVGDNMYPLPSQKCTVW